MKRPRCAGCRKAFTPSVRVSEQRYCADPLCQRERRRIWQSRKRRSDPDYRETEQITQQIWREEHPDYSKDYRQKHPKYAQENRRQQPARDAKRRGKRRRRGVKLGPKRVLANVDAAGVNRPIKSGTYELKMTGENALANGDSIRVEISVLSAT